MDAKRGQEVTGPLEDAGAGVGGDREAPRAPEWDGVGFKRATLRGGHEDHVCIP